MPLDRFSTPATPDERIAVLDRVRTLCHLPQGEHGCWLWRGSGSDHATRRPIIHFRGRTSAVRRVVFFLQHGFEAPPGTVATGCGAPGCVSPYCVRALPRKTVMRRSAKAGRCSTPEANLARKLAAQARVHIDADRVELARTLPMSAAAAARVTGISKQHISNIRAGRARTPLDMPPPPPRVSRQQAAALRSAAAAAAAAERARKSRMQTLATREAIAGIWAGLLT